MSTSVEQYPDYCSMEGAKRLMERLVAFWSRQGYTTHKFWIEREVNPARRTESVCVVRSNLLNGLPPRKANNNG